MTKMHFQQAADLVKAILDGQWTNDPPEWALTWRDVQKMETEPYYDAESHGCGAAAYDYTRAVQTAEAFIKLFSEFNPRFDEQRFLVACGLVVAPAKARRKA